MFWAEDTALTSALVEHIGLSMAGFRGEHNQGAGHEIWNTCTSWPEGSACST